MLPGARVGPTADVGGRLTSVGGGPERLGPVRRPQPASLPRHPRGPPGSPLAGAGPERGRSGRQAAAPRNQGYRQRSLGAAGGLQVATPSQERGQDRHRTRQAAPAPQGVRVQTAAGGWRPRRPGSLLTWPFPASRRAPASRPQKFPSRAHRAPPTGAKSLVPGSRAPGHPPRRCPPCARALSDRSPVPERRGGAGGGRARARAPGTAGRAGWRRQERRGARVAPASRESSDC